MLDSHVRTNKDTALKTKSHVLVILFYDVSEVMKR